MQIRSGIVVCIGAFALLLRPEKASAFTLTDLICDGEKASPYYWAIYATAQAARASGAFKTRDDCEFAGSAASDAGSTVSLPTGTVTSCVCKDIFGDAPPSKPACRIAHNVCTEGSSLPLDMTQRTDCIPTGSMYIAEDVCTFDPYCCNTFWDQQCVQEVTSSFWDTEASRYIQWSIEGRPNCVVNEGNAPMTPEQIAIYQAECPGGRITPQSALSGALNDANQMAANMRNSDALCLGAVPGHLYASGEFSDGNYDFSSFSTDWDPGFYKAQCASGFVQLGVSAGVYWFGSFGWWYPHAILCELDSPGVFTGKHTATLTLPGDHRRYSRLGNWDAGFKLECGKNEYVAGVSQDPSALMGNSVVCASSPGLSNNGCHVVSTTDGSTAGSAGDGDWDYGYYKGECGPSEYIAGIAFSTELQFPEALLCCAR